MASKKKVISDQADFFNRDAKTVKGQIKEQLFFNYVNREQLESVDWVADRKKILDYGCGTGNTMDLFFRNKSQKNYSFFGVDIAKETVKVIQKKYPKYSFYHIKNNSIPQLKNDSMDAVMMMHILHHAKNHDEIFEEVHRVLKKGGKYVINDLCSNNPINWLGRKAFVLLPHSMQDKFNDDLVADGCIPEKYKVDIDVVIQELKDHGFKVTEVIYGHLFFFTFIWLDKFLPLSKIGFIKSFYEMLIGFEHRLLKNSKLFQGKAELFCIKAVKK